MLCLVGTRASRDLLQLAGRVDGINAQKAVFHRKTAFFNIQPGKAGISPFFSRRELWGCVRLRIYALAFFFDF